LPSAGVGALAILMAFGFDFSLIALIGIILLIGIVKKNGIMMVDFAIAAEREEHLSAKQSIRKAALLRFRPIMMTTMAALFGGLPLMLGTGTGSEIRQPLGYAMVGGLIVSQALTLFTTPVVYLYLDNLSNALSRWTQGKKTGGSELPADEIKQAADKIARSPGLWNFPTAAWSGIPCLGGPSREGLHWPFPDFPRFAWLSKTAIPTAVNGRGVLP